MRSCTICVKGQLRLIDSQREALPPLNHRNLPPIPERHIYECTVCDSILEQYGDETPRPMLRMPHLRDWLWSYFDATPSMIPDWVQSRLYWRDRSETAASAAYRGDKEAFQLLKTRLADIGHPLIVPLLGIVVDRYRAYGDIYKEELRAGKRVIAQLQKQDEDELRDRLIESCLELLDQLGPHVPFHLVSCLGSENPDIRKVAELMLLWSGIRSKQSMAVQEQVLAAIDTLTSKGRFLDSSDHVLLQSIPSAWSQARQQLAVHLDAASGAAIHETTQRLLRLEGWDPSKAASSRNTMAAPLSVRQWMLILGGLAAVALLWIFQPAIWLRLHPSPTPVPARAPIQHVTTAVPVAPTDIPMETPTADPEYMWEVAEQALAAVPDNVFVIQRVGDVDCQSIVVLQDAFVDTAPCEHPWGIYRINLSPEADTLPIAFSFDLPDCQVADGSGQGLGRLEPMFRHSINVYCPETNSVGESIGPCFSPYLFRWGNWGPDGQSQDWIQMSFPELNKCF